MIRLGNSGNKPEQAPVQEKSVETQNNYEKQQQQQQPDSFNSTPGRAVSESETMARDIKEGRLSGFVGGGTTLTGEANFHAMLRVDGHLTGKVTSDKGTLIIGSTGKVDANVTVATAIVNGMVNGDIVASENLELKRTARVVGNIKTPRLIMEDGAILEGSCSMISAKENLDKRNAKPMTSGIGTPATGTSGVGTSTTGATPVKPNAFPGSENKPEENKDKKPEENKDAATSKTV